MAKRSGEYVYTTGTQGTNDNDVVYLASTNVRRLTDYNVHYIESTLATVDVDVSIDGTNWIPAVAGRSLVATASGTHILEAAVNVCLEIKGVFADLRVNQKGASAANAVVTHAKI